MATVMTSPVDSAAIQDLSARLRGALLRPGDEGYDSARRVWNAMIDRRPALIVRCLGAADVMVAVQVAREHGLPLSIRGGGHNVAGHAVCDGGLMLDLSPMKQVWVDPVARTARGAPGVLWQEFDHETQAFGLATVGGVVSTTGIAGLTLGGGQGWLTGAYGLTVDNLLSADVVTADGTLVRANAIDHADLFWALRGAGANFGVVTSFEYQLHPVSTVLGGMVVHPLDHAAEVLRFYREFAAAQPDEVTTYAGLLTTPDGHPVVALVTCCLAPLDEGERLIAPLRQFGAPVADTIAPIPYTAMQAIIGANFPPGRRNYWKSSLTHTITDETIETLVDYVRRVPSPFTAVVFADCHGAYARVDTRATAYSHRDLQYDLVILSSWVAAADTDRNIRWTQELFDAIQPHMAQSVYVNDLGDDEGGARVQSAYGANYARLVELKNRYDPANLFHLNQNIKPST